MAADEKWYFTKEQLQNTPSRRCGFDADKELSYRQQAANFIQDMGQKLQVSQLCINTAIVYMHRFYMFHSFTHFPWNTIAAASFFLAAKVEEQPRKLEHVIRIANHCLHRDQPTAFDAKSEQYAAQSQDLVFNENVLLQTLGFDVAIDHPHTHVVRCCHLVRASKDLAQTSYFMASNSLHLTTMCLQYKPTVVACFCIHLACKWSNWQIPKSIEGKDWFYYVDKSVTSDLLEQLTAEFLKIFDKCPSRLKRKISQSTINQNHSQTIDQLHAASSSSSPFDPDSRKLHSFEKEGGGVPTFHPRSHHEAKTGVPEKPGRPHDPAAAAAVAARDREYREKKERERLEHQKAAKAAAAAGLASSGGKHMAHHRPPATATGPLDPAAAAKLKLHHPPGMSNGRESHRDRDRERYLAQQQQHPGQKPVGPDGKMPVKQHDPNRHRDRHRDQVKPPGPGAASATSAVNSVSASDLLAKPPKPNSNAPVSSSSSSSVQDKNSYLSKQINSTSQRHKSPFTDASKSVPVPTLPTPAKANGSAPPPTDLPSLSDELTLTLPAPKKTSSLFSPEKTPPHQNKKSWPGTKTPTPPSSGKRSTETPALPATAVVPPPLSPFGSPPPPPSRDKSTPISTPTPNSLRRPRTASSGSEPELRPVVKKLDQTPGFENIIRDSKMGIKLPKVPDIIQPFCDRAADSTETSISKELKPPDIIKPFNTSLLETPPAPVTQSQPPLVNGIESDPAVISTLLKEAAPTLNHLAPEDMRPPEPVTPSSTVASVPPAQQPTSTDSTASAPTDKHKSSDHHHKSEKKKKKDKHKHKDKDKGRDEKKKKHKDKDKERHKSKPEKTETLPEVEVPLKITISKDKLQPVLDTSSVGSGLKVKISKDRLKSDVIEPPPPNPAPSTLKIKISKDQIQYNSVVDSGSSTSSSSRKRERDKAVSSSSVPPAKLSKTSYGSGGRDSSRQNGRNSYNKVAQLGDGEAAQVRLAESKYHSKGASKTS